MKNELTYADFEIWMSENGYHADDDADDVFDIWCEENGLTCEESDDIWDRR